MRADAPYAATAGAARALLIQFVVAVLVLGGGLLLARSVLHWPLDRVLPALVLAQGAGAALAGRHWGLARWWVAIQFFFPVAVFAALALDVPPVVWLGAFLALLGVYGSVFRTRVPLYPSSRPARDALAGMLPRDRPFRLVDIGSGTGGVALQLAERFPLGEVTGIELALVPWAVSRLRSRLRGSRARFVRGDYDSLDLGEYDYVYAYLSPAAMPALVAKAGAEMRPGALLISCEFDLPGIEPAVSVLLSDGTRLHGWRPAPDGVPGPVTELVPVDRRPSPARRHSSRSVPAS